MRIKAILFLLIFSALSAWGQNAAGMSVLDIDSAVKLALENNLSLGRSEQESAAARRRYENSWNSFIPALSAGASMSRNTSLTHEVLPPLDSWTHALSLSASLSINPASFANINQTRREYESGLLSLASARHEMEFQVRLLYYQLLLLRANADLAMQNILSAQSRHEQTLTLLSVGQASNLDELSARLDLQNQISNAQNAEGAYQNALDNFKYLLLLPMNEEIVLLGDLLSLRNLSSFSSLSSLSSPASRPQNGPSISSESMNISTLRQSIAVTEAQRSSILLRTYSPTLSLSWNSAPRYNNVSDQWLDNGQFSIALSFRLDNYLPWSSAREQVNTLNDSLARQYSLLGEALINHQNNVEKLLRDLSRSEEAINNLYLNLTLAEETLRMSEEAYARGTLDLQTLYSRRDNLAAVQNRIMTEQFNFLSTILELERELNLPYTSIAWEE